MTTKAWSYIRLSTADQIEGHGETRQEDASRAYAEAHGLDLQEPIRDLGKSGYHGTHRKTGNLGKFLRLVELGLVPSGSYFLVENCDRLSREDPLTAFETFSTIINAGISVVTTDDGQVYNRDLLRRDPMKLIFWIMQTIRGNAESDRKSKMVTKAAAARKVKAIEAGRAISGRAPTWLRKTKGGFEVEPVKKRIIERIFRELDQGLGGSRIAQRLNDDGVEPFNDYKTRKTRGWHHAVILHIAKSRSVLGEHQMTKLEERDGEKVRVPDGPPRENWWPRVLDDEALFYRVQDLISDRLRGSPNRGGGRRGKTVSNLFVGLCICHGCGDQMNYYGAFTSEAGVRTRATFKCGNAARKAGCTNKRRYDYQRFEEMILRFVSECELTGEGRNPAEIELDLMEARRADTQRKLDKLVSMLEDDDPPATVMKLIRQRENDLNALVEEIDRHREQNRRAGAMIPPQEHQKAVRGLLAEMAGLPDEELFRVRARLSVGLASLIDEIVFSEKGAQVVRLKNGAVTYVVTPEKIVRLDSENQKVTKAGRADDALRAVRQSTPFIGSAVISAGDLAEIRGDLAKRTG